MRYLQRKQYRLFCRLKTCYQGCLCVALAGEQGSCAVVRALDSHQCGPGSIPGVDAICGLSLLLVLVPALRVFLWVLRFSSLHKHQHFQILIQPRSSKRIATLWMCHRNPHLFIYSDLFIY